MKTTIETKIAKNGTVNTYVDGKRTNSREAVKVAKENGLPIYQASCLTYAGRYIEESFASPVSAYMWLVNKSNSNPNFADGSQEIVELTGDKHTVGNAIYENWGSKFNVTDAELESFILTLDNADAKEIQSRIRKFAEMVKRESYKLTPEYQIELQARAKREAAEEAKRAARQFARDLAEKIAVESASVDTNFSGAYYTRIGSNVQSAQLLSDDNVDVFSLIGDIEDTDEDDELVDEAVVEVESTADDGFEIQSGDAIVKIKSDAIEIHADGTVTKFYFNQFDAKFRAAVVKDGIGIIHYCIFDDDDTEIHDVREHEVGFDGFVAMVKERNNQPPTTPDDESNNDDEKVFELMDELDEIGNDIIETRDILERKVAQGAPRDELKQLADYIAEREGEYRDLHQKIHGSLPQSYTPDDVDADKILAVAMVKERDNQSPDEDDLGDVKIETKIIRRKHISRDTYRVTFRVVADGVKMTFEDAHDIAKKAVERGANVTISNEFATIDFNQNFTAKSIADFARNTDVYIGEEFLHSRNGNELSIYSKKYGVEMRVCEGEVSYDIFDGEGDKLTVTQEKFFAIMADRGLIQVDVTKLPATDADKKIAELAAEHAAAEKFCDECQAELNAARHKFNDAVNQTSSKLDALKLFAEKVADNFTEKISSFAKDYPNIEVESQYGFSTIPYLETVNVRAMYFGDGQIIFHFNCVTSTSNYFKLGEYSTAERAQTVIDQLSDALARGDKKFTFPADEPETPAPETPETPERTRLQPADVRATWLSQEWAIDTYIYAEDDNGNEVDITDGDVKDIEKSLRGKYYINHTGDGVEFFAEDCNASLLSAICTELEERGCLIEDYHDAWQESRDYEETVIKHMNQHAPEDWKVVYDGETNRVEYKGKRVADVETICMRDKLAPRTFFNQFAPLVDKTKTPAQIFLDDRYRELDELNEMRQSPGCTPAAAAKLDEMIERVKRDIAETEFGATDDVESFCKSGAVDEHGNAWF